MKNGLYLTKNDFSSWSDEISELLTTSDTYSEGLGMPVKNVTFVVTEMCNLNCTYCYETHKTNRRMSKEIAKQAVDFLFDREKINGYFDHDHCQAIILEFIGGEPLLEIELIDYVVEYFKAKAFNLNSPWAYNYMISMTSNGVLYLTDKVQNFLKKNPGKVSLSITIDGNKELHDSCRLFYNGKGSYDIVEKSIKHLVANTGMDQTKITLSPENLHFLNDALKNVWSLGLKGAFANCVFEEGWTTEHAKLLYSEMIKLADYLLEDERYAKYYCSLFDDYIGKDLIDTQNFCGGNGEMLAIGTDGQCFPCIRFMKYALSSPGRKEQPVGDIFKGLDSKQHNPWLLELKKIDMISQSEDKCINCTIASGCSLCTGYNYDKFGTPNKRATYICEMHQARVLANVYYWNKLYKILNLDKKFEMNINKEWALNIISESEYNKLIEMVGE